MKDYTIHINVRVTKEGDRYVSMTKERIWRSLVGLNTYTTNGIQMPGFIFDGLGLTLITNTAIIVEGVIADIIDEYSINTGKAPNWGVNLMKATWADKRKMYNSLFNRKLELYRGFDAIKIIFLFRNNVAHGLAHIEQSSIQEVTNTRSDLKSVNNNYQSIRQFFIDRNLIKVTDISSNTNHLWQYNNAAYLWLEAKCFLEDVLKQNESKFNDGIISEWQTAVSGQG